MLTQSHREYAKSIYLNVCAGQIELWMGHRENSSAKTRNPNQPIINLCRFTCTHKVLRDALRQILANTYKNQTPRCDSPPAVFAKSQRDKACWSTQININTNDLVAGCVIKMIGLPHSLCLSLFWAAKKAR